MKYKTLPIEESNPFHVLNQDHITVSHRCLLVIIFALFDDSKLTTIETLDERMRKEATYTHACEGSHERRKT